MSRCGCSGSTGCSCRLLAGEGITITGAGTATDPFRIVATITSFAASFLVQDTDTVNLNLFGAGTTDDPFILTGTSSVAMTQLSDWEDVAGPALGEVPVWNGLKWEAAAPPTQPVGTVHTSTGITGDGTLVTPIKVAVADTTTTSTSGLATYVDSAGKLRVVAPTSVDTTWAAITGKPDTFPSTWGQVSGKPASYPDSAKIGGHRFDVQSTAPSAPILDDVWIKR